MKIKRLIFGLAIGFLMVVVVWLRFHSETPYGSTTAVANNIPNVLYPVTNLPVMGKIKSNLGTAPANVSSNSDLQNVAEYVHKTRRDPQYDWKQPINFYGRVVDENNAPVSDANAHFNWTDLSENGTSAADVKSDGNGFFSLTGRHGKRMSLTISKEGYYTPRDAMLASYEYANPDDGLFTPDVDNPIVFRLRKKGQPEELVHIARSYLIPSDGSRVGLDLLSGRQVDAAGEGQLEIQCLTSNEKDGQNRYDWQCSISVPNGGIKETKEEFPFEAPIEGYQSRIEFDMPRSKPDWQRTVEGQYFLKLPNGDYARLYFTMISYGDHFCTVDSLLNPNGSRNLEPK